VLDISSDESPKKTVHVSPPFIPVSPATQRAIELLEESDIGSDWSEFDEAPPNTTNNEDRLAEGDFRVKRVTRRAKRPSSTKVSAKRKPRQDRSSSTKVPAKRRRCTRGAGVEAQSSHTSIRENALRGSDGVTLAGMTEEELKVLYPEFILAGYTVKKEPWS
jgi:hypothetical protein